MRRWIGRWVGAVGAVHVAVGLLVYRERLLAIVGDGVWNAVDGHTGRPLAFWFVFAGLLTMVFGRLLDWMEGQGLSAPRSVGWSFLAVVVIGIVSVPVGGGWLLLPPALGLVRGVRRNRPTASG